MRRWRCIRLRSDFFYGDIDEKYSVCPAADCTCRSSSLYTAEVKNDLVRQEGNRLVVTYDLEGTEKEAKVAVTIIVAGKTYGADKLHLEGDVGTVRPGKGKKVWWNVLQDFPRGLHDDIEVNVSAAGREFIGILVTGMEFVWVPGGCYQMGVVPGRAIVEMTKNRCTRSAWMVSGWAGPR